MSETSNGCKSLFENGPHAERHVPNAVRRTFKGPNSNESAFRLFQFLDSMMDTLHHDDHVFLMSIELDTEVGRFPDVLLQFVRDINWNRSRIFFVAPILQVKNEDYPIGRLTFEARPGDALAALRHGSGVRWGVGLALWGMQVADRDVPDVVPLTPFEREQRDRICDASRMAWIADPELDGLTVWLGPSVDQDQREAVAQLL